MTQNNAQIKVGSILVSLILVATIIPILSILPAFGNLSNPSVLKNHNPIYIYRDYGFTTANGVVSGNGTKNNPYIIENWSIDATSDYGIEIRSTSSYFIIRNCYIYNGTNISSYPGIYFYNVNYGRIENNKIVHCYDGIYFYYSNYNIISNNTFNSNYNGIYCSRSFYNTIKNNTCSFNNYCGIYIFNANYNVIVNNSCNSNNNHGTFLEMSDSNILSNNTIQSNIQRGVTLYYSYSNQITTNINLNNNYGIYICDSGSNKIYNNCFNNTYNYYEDWLSSNNWNVTRTAGKNIVGGSYLGGNFWSDYTGTDTDGDGIGDTNVPFGPGDNLPLLDLHTPEIIDNTTGIPTTGEPFAIKAIAWDNLIVRNVYTLWSTDFMESNMSMTRVAGDLKYGIYSGNLLVPSNTTKIYYILNAVDICGNLKSTSKFKLDVIDNDKPIIIDNTNVVPTTGDNFTLNVSVEDNINLSRVQVEYWFNNGPHKKINLITNGTNYYENITVAYNARVLEYKLHAVDGSNNKASIDGQILNVTDNDPPLILDLSERPTTGDEFTFTFYIYDNIMFLKADLEYWFDDNTHTNITLPEDQTHPITIPADAFELHYIVTAEDAYNNIGVLEFDKPIIDNDVPILEDITTDVPETGEIFLLECKVIENRKVSNISVAYWFDEIGYIVESMTLLKGNYVLEVEVPEYASSIHFSISVRDTNNNSDIIDNNLNVQDVIPPTLTDQTEGKPTTGEEFEIIASVVDNIGIQSFNLEYWFNKMKHINVTFNNSLSINISSDAEIFTYILCTVDYECNVKIINKTLMVTDNDPPVIKMYTKSNPTTGEYYGFNVQKSDNIGIESSYLKYWFDDSALTKIDIVRYYSIIVPNNTKLLHYSIYAEDANKNYVYLNDTLDVIDNDNPIVIDNSIRTSGVFKFIIDVLDNIEISEVRVEYKFDSGASINTPLKYNDGSQYEDTIMIPKDANKLYYIISAKDSAGNWEITDETEVILREMPTVSPEQKSSEPGPSLKSGIIWMSAIIILVVIILIILGLYFFFIRKRRTQKDALKMESYTITPNTPSTGVLASPAPTPQPITQVKQATPLQQLHYSYSQPTPQLTSQQTQKQGNIITKITPVTPSIAQTQSIISSTSPSTLLPVAQLPAVEPTTDPSQTEETTQTNKQPQNPPQGQNLNVEK